MNIWGYIRPDGQVGIRNMVAVIPTVVCASETAKHIAERTRDTIYLPNQHGCCQLGNDMQLTTQTLINLGKNPNIAAVLVVGLGCEGVPIKKVADEIAAGSRKRVEHLIIQEQGGTLKTEEKGLRLVRDMIQETQSQHREQTDLSRIILALECGGSDATSGLVSNPVTGYVSDKLISLGGTTIFSETTEIIGAEHIFSRRAKSDEVKKKLLDTVAGCEQKARDLGFDMRGGQPTPGNIQGGLTTIEEKSLGCIYKGGKKQPLNGVLDYAQIPVEKGLHFMDTPGQDIESITGMLAGGAQVVIFTTGRGTPTGSPIAPVIKITGNKTTYENMKDNIEFDASPVIDGRESIAQAGERLFQELIEVINGKQTKAEALGHREFGMYKLHSTF